MGYERDHGDGRVGGWGVSEPTICERVDRTSLETPVGNLVPLEQLPQRLDCLVGVGTMWQEGRGDADVQYPARRGVPRDEVGPTERLASLPFTAALPQVDLGHRWNRADCTYVLTSDAGPSLHGSTTVGVPPK